MPEPDPAPRWSAGAIILLAVLLRAGVVLSGMAGGFDELPGDALYYSTIAENVAGGNGFLEFKARAYRPPGLPALLGAVYAVAGVSPGLGKLVLCLVAGLDCWVLMLLVGLVSTRRAALLAGLFFAGYPVYLDQPARLVPVVLYLLLLHLALCLLLLALRRESLRLHLAAGVVLGLSALTREMSLAVPIAVACWYRTDPERRPLGRAWLALCAGLAAVVGVWTVRNFVVLGGFVLITTNAGINLYESNRAEYDLWTYDWVIPPGIDWDQGAGELAAHQQGARLAIQFAATHPLRTLKLWAINQYVLWRPPFHGLAEAAGKERILRLVALIAYLALLVLAWLGYRAPGDRRPLQLVLWLCAWLSLPFMLCYANHTYRMPMESLLMLPAAVGADRLLRRRGG